VLDSDLDWGQNTIRLARRLREVGADHVSFNEFNFSGPQLMKWPGLPMIYPVDPHTPRPGWNAISPTMWMTQRYKPVIPGRQPWFPYLRPAEKVGSLWLYFIEPRAIPRIP